MLSRVCVNTEGLDFYAPACPTADAMKTAEPKAGGYVCDRIPGTEGHYLLDDADGTRLVSHDGKSAFPKPAFKGMGRLWREGYAPTYAGTFTREYLASKEPFGAVRLMNWLATNNSPLVRWATRCRPEDQYWSTDYGGPVEPWLDWAKGTGKGLWLNVPHQADDDYVRQLAMLCKARIGDAPVPLYLEYSNEIWNGQFKQFAWVSAKGGVRWHADRTVFIARTFRELFGHSDKRIRPIFGARASDPWYAQEGLKQLGNRTQELYGLAIAPYIGNGYSDSWNAYGFADHVERTVERWLLGDGETTTKTRRHRELCDNHGLKLTAYEGAVDFGQFGNESAKAAAQELPALGRGCERYIDWWMKESGGGEFFWYKDFSLWNRSGVWGLSNAPKKLDGPKFKAVARAAAKYPVTPGQHSPTPTEPPPTPTPTAMPRIQSVRVAVDPDDKTRLRITWDAVPGAQMYRVYRQEPGTNDHLAIQDVTTNVAFSFGKVAGGYSVKANAGERWSPPGNVARYDGDPRLEALRKERDALVAVLPGLRAALAEKTARLAAIEEELAK